MGAGTGRWEPSSVCFLRRFESKVTSRAEIQFSLTFSKQQQHQNPTPAWKGRVGTTVVYSVRNATSPAPLVLRINDYVKKRHNQWKSNAGRKWSSEEQHVREGKFQEHSRFTSPIYISLYMYFSHTYTCRHDKICLNLKDLS